jgi:murein DD-endopeptidase MepM/ murein hydrolase activator NlpD
MASRTRHITGLVGAALACLGVAAGQARAADLGGVAAPATEGGAEYGAPVLPRVAARGLRPVASLFQVSPDAVVSGASLPRIALRIDQRGVRAVTARIVFLPVGGAQGRILRVSLGRVRTGRRIIVPWPKDAVLAPGTYLVRLHARGPGGATLLRRAHTAGKSTLVVREPPAPPPPPPAPAPAPAPVVGQVLAGGTFPVAGPHTFGGPDGRFGAPRNGHIHQGQDIPAAEGTPVVAPFPGTITTTNYQAGAAGYYVVEHSDVADFFFAHCQQGSFGVAIGAPVTAGQQLCRVGHTGDAEGPHLHFEIWLGGWRVGPASHPIDPLPSLLAWDHPSP